MQFVVLESFVGSEYNDSPLQYEFPPRYLKVFGPLSRGEPVFAVIYEPRGESGAGRMAYVGWATITAPPHRTGRVSRRKEPLWAVDYVGGFNDFAHTAPRKVGGVAIESFIAHGVGPAQVGNAVRPLPESEAIVIINIGFGGERSADIAYPTSLPQPQLVVADRQRVERMVTTLERDARFRQSVLKAYEFRCAVSGFMAEGVRPGRITRLIEAAHVRPVAMSGPDDITNGLALTPTLHKMFDEGLFTMAYDGQALRVRTSPRLEDAMIKSPDGSFAIPLRSGLLVRTPPDAGLAPHRDALRYHENHIFRGN
jgi:putative restriction endonuclease